MSADNANIDNEIKKLEIGITKLETEKGLLQSKADTYEAKWTTATDVGERKLYHETLQKTNDRIIAIDYQVTEDKKRIGTLEQRKNQGIQEKLFIVFINSRLFCVLFI